MKSALRGSEDGARLRKPVVEMTPEELCQEANRLRRSISSAAEHLGSVYEALYTRMRRTPSDDMTYAFLSVANSGKRFAGMIVSAARRTEGAEARAILSAQRETNERRRREEESERWKAREEAKKAKKKAAEEQPKKDPLELLFEVPATPVSNSDIADEMVRTLMGSGTTSSDLDDLYGAEDDEDDLDEDDLDEEEDDDEDDLDEDDDFNGEGL